MNVKTLLFRFALLLSVLLLMGIAAGCEDDGIEVDSDSGTGGDGVAPLIPRNHGEKDCNNNSCHGPEGALPNPDDGDHNAAVDEDCGSCHS